MTNTNHTTSATQKAVNVIANNIVVATIPMSADYGLHDIMKTWADVDGIILRPAGQKVFGSSRNCAYGFLRRDNRWWTLTSVSET